MLYYNGDIANHFNQCKKRHLIVFDSVHKVFNDLETLI